jgi:hypothetical protein
MTERSEGDHPTTLELATQTIVRGISDLISTAHARHNLKDAASGLSFTETEFRRIIVLYLPDKTLSDWCRDLGIDNPEGSSHRPE